ncbi:MAG TPA: glycosyltransferase family 9 protein [Candidatus Sulfotelmatobacter sp.]|nr:glycosyltransferase family 9 protein [Candidatus Sulfotelmatobacter sp.]
MTAELARQASIRQILIVRLSAMGDVIHTLPAAQALREAFPQATIGWLIEERWVELLCAAGTVRRGQRSAQRPLADWVHTVNLREWKKSLWTLTTAQQIARVWNDIRSARYDVAVDLQGAIRSAVLARWSGAPVIWGTAEPRESPASLWYTRQAIPRGVHVVEQNLSVVEAIVQRSLRTPGVELPFDPKAQHRMDDFLAGTGVRDFAILNPGAGWGAKCWPAERYGAVARALFADGISSIINYGPGEEGLAQEVQSSSGPTARLLKCSIGELIELTRRARLFVGGDTGPMHLAAALRVPVVAIFGPTNPARNGPYEAKSIVLRDPASPTTHARRSQPDEGLLAISTDEVVHAARSLLSSGKAEPAHA